jgi:topoisomerase IA-like protein
MARYSKKTQDQVEKTMHKEKAGTLRSGSGAKVKSRKQAIAIALSEAREKGYKAPAKAAAKKATPKKAAAKKTTTRKVAPKKKTVAHKAMA